MPETRDVVCGMTFDEETAEDLGAVVVERAGKRHYFCSPTCADSYREDPARYAG